MHDRSVNPPLQRVEEVGAMSIGSDFAGDGLCARRLGPLRLQTASMRPSPTRITGYRAAAGLPPRGDMRPFDFIIIGGGTFGAALAEHLWFRSADRSERVLVLEGGPFLLPEHVQNLPVLGLGAATRAPITSPRKRSGDWPRTPASPSPASRTASADGRSTGAAGRRACSTPNCRRALGRRRYWTT